MFSSPFSSKVAFVCLGAKEVPDLKLHQEEEGILSDLATEKRKLEFALGRAAARKALEKLGFKEPGAILKGERRQPIWPEGIVGSLTHSHELAVAAAVRQSEVRSIGIDVEYYRKSKIEMVKKIATAREESWILSEGKEIAAARVIDVFSAKESVYKAISNLTHTIIGFKDISLGLTGAPKGFAFLATLLEDIDEEFRAGIKIPVGIRKAGDFVLSFAVIQGRLEL